MAEAFVEPRVQTDNTAGFTLDGGARETNQWRQVNLIIEPKANRFRLRIQTIMPDFLNPLEDAWEDDIPIEPGQLWGAVQACRKAWHNGAVHYQRNADFPLQNDWDFSDEHDLSSLLLGPLAVAGSSLFQTIFFPSQGIDSSAFQALRKIGDALRRQTAKGSMWMRVTSDKFYAPWNLIYSHELKDRVNGRDARPDGFWGYQHLVEHVPRAGGLVNAFDFEQEQPLQVTLQWDQNIDATLNVPCNAVVKNLMESYDDHFLKHIPRPFKNDFAAALAGDALRDHIIYFCCHAQVEGDNTAPRIDESYLALTDNINHITSASIEQWMGERSYFERCPIVFLNACESAQMNSLFYQGFAPTFLNRKASCVIGTQTEIPAIFAGQFARRFFEEFFKGGGRRSDGKPERQVGSILWNLRREFLDQYNNPLGLLYSVYRGADVFLPKPLPKKAAK